MVTYNSLQQRPINQIGSCTFRVSGELLHLAQSLTPLNFMVTNYYRFTSTACSALSGLTGTGNIKFFAADRQYLQFWRDPTSAE